MAGDTVITVIGNLTADPELRFTPSGAAVANFTVASTPRTFDRNTNEWKDGEALFLRCNIWREAAENVAESLTKGTRVIVSGRLKQRSYDDREGQRRTVVELEVDEIGPSRGTRRRSRRARSAAAVAAVSVAASRAAVAVTASPRSRLRARTSPQTIRGAAPPRPGATSAAAPTIRRSDPGSNTVYGHLAARIDLNKEYQHHGR
ncbi:hypothetical protein MTP03_47150 [Tsukamurella sp. PLM1]|nr:hypothetical protein MTP03_47150 [Tsukamurella sp. PLM1]